MKAYLIRKIIDMAKVSASKDNNAESTDTLTVLQSIGSPLAYHNKIPFGNDTLGDAMGAESDPMADLVKDLTKPGKLAAELVKALYECDHEKELKDCAGIHH